MKRVALLLMICSLYIATATAQSKCGIENTAFKSGERLTYNLYFNWKFVWFKVGFATMNTDLTTFEGKQVLRHARHAALVLQY